MKHSRIRRLNSANYERGLTVVLDARSAEYRTTSADFVGFKVLVHDPGAFPEVEGHAVAVGAAKEFFISVTASHTEGCVKTVINDNQFGKSHACCTFRSKAILDFPFEGRSCLFSSERNFPKSEVGLKRKS